MKLTFATTPGVEYEPHRRDLPARQRVRLPQPDQPAEALRHTLGPRLRGPSGNDKTLRRILK